MIVHVSRSLARIGTQKILGNCVKCKQAPGLFLTDKKKLSTVVFRRPIIKCEQHVCAKYYSQPNFQGVKSAMPEVFSQLCSKLITVGIVCGRQCTIYSMTHCRRLKQAIVYLSAYFTHTATKNSSLPRRLLLVLERLQRKQLSLRNCLMAGAVLFNWRDECISDKDLDKAIRESMKEMKNLRGLRDKREGTKLNSVEAKKVQRGEDWEEVIEEDNVTMWRRRLDSKSSVYEYKVFGTYKDITARSFWNVQLNLAYRKKWDDLVIKLDVIEREPHHGCEIVHWISHYPFPMDAREYVFVRRAAVDHERGAMVLMSRSVTSSKVQEALAAASRPKRCVRVRDYFSQMVITPHTNFDENGFDYVLVYYDDPRAMIPSKAYNWASTYGVLNFLKRIHQAVLDSIKQDAIDKSPFGQDDMYSDHDRKTICCCPVNVHRKRN